MRNGYKNKKPIKIIMYPIDDREEYERSLGTAMLDILERQLGSEGLALAMEQLKHEIGR
jgi:hypothetical protein